MFALPQMDSIGGSRSLVPGVKVHHFRPFGVPFCYFNSYHLQWMLCELGSFVISISKVRKKRLCKLQSTLRLRLVMVRLCSFTSKRRLYQCPFPSLPYRGDNSHSSSLMRLPLSPSPSFDMQPSPPPARPSIRVQERASLLDHDFNFQIVVFEVYFLSSKFHTKKESQQLFKRSRMHSFRFLEMASTFQEPPLRQCLHYRRHRRIVLMKAAVLKIPSISSCQESRCTTFGRSCASYIRCAFR